MVGYDAKNKDTLDEKFICPVCALIFRDPIQLNRCGHRLCQSCTPRNPKSIVKCPICQAESQKNQVVLDHRSIIEILLLHIRCFLCEWGGVFKDYENHLHVHPHPRCTSCGKQCNSVIALNEHRVFECPQSMIKCRLTLFGCNEQFIGTDLHAHYLTRKHQESIITALLIILKQSSATGLPSATNIGHILNNNTEDLHSALRRLSGEQRNSRMNFLSVKLSIEENRNPSTSIQINANQHLVETDEGTNQPLTCSDDGLFIWKIQSVQEKIIDALSGRQTSIDSPSFYSSANGYKMSARLYLNGDGNARGTHLSLFFVLMRGLNDEILRFPFKYQVVFCLYDQSDAKKHIIDSFRPDINSSSFQRPRSDMNIAIGIPKFVPLALIQQEGNPYVQENTMFIGIMINFINISQSMLPCAFAICPSIPPIIRLLMIEAEETRRKQTKEL